MTDRDLLRLVREHLDLIDLLATHPEVSLADIDALWRRLGVEEPACQLIQGDRAPSALPPPRSTAARPAVGPGLFDAAAPPPGHGASAEGDSGSPVLPPSRSAASSPSDSSTLSPSHPPTSSRPTLRLLARSDGASRGNPGPAAIGVVVQDPDGTILREVGERIANTTNNVAEYVAVLRAIEEAIALGATDLTLLLDSELLVKQLTGLYRVKAPHLQPYYQQALHLLRQLARWQARHVPREQNARADALANRALDS